MHKQRYIYIHLKTNEIDNTSQKQKKQSNPEHKTNEYTTSTIHKKNNRTHTTQLNNIKRKFIYVCI